MLTTPTTRLRSRSASRPDSFTASSAAIPWRGRRQGSCRGSGLNHHHADAVRDNVMEIARDPAALLLGREHRSQLLFGGKLGGEVLEQRPGSGGGTPRRRTPAATTPSSSTSPRPRPVSRSFPGRRSRRRRASSPAEPQRPAISATRPSGNRAGRSRARSQRLLWSDRHRRPLAQATPSRRPRRRPPGPGSTTEASCRRRQGTGKASGSTASIAGPQRVSATAPTGPRPRRDRGSRGRRAKALTLTVRRAGRILPTGTCRPPTVGDHRAPIETGVDPNTTTAGRASLRPAAIVTREATGLGREPSATPPKGHDDQPPQPQRTAHRSRLRRSQPDRDRHHSQLAQGEHRRNPGIAFYAKHHSTERASILLAMLAFAFFLAFASCSAPAFDAGTAATRSASSPSPAPSCSSSASRPTPASHSHSPTWHPPPHPPGHKHSTSSTKTLFFAIAGGGRVFAIAARLAILRNRPLPRWLGWSALATGLALLRTPLRPRPDRARSLWTLPASVLLPHAATFSRWPSRGRRLNSRGFTWPGLLDELAQVLVDEGDRHAALADGGGDALDRAEADVAAGEDAGHARLEQVRVAVERPAAARAARRRR